VGGGGGGGGVVQPSSLRIAASLGKPKRQIFLKRGRRADAFLPGVNIITGVRGSRSQFPSGRAGLCMDCSTWKGGSFHFFLNFFQGGGGGTAQEYIRAQPSGVNREMVGGTIFQKTAWGGRGAAETAEAAHVSSHGSRVQRLKRSGVLDRASEPVRGNTSVGGTIIALWGKKKNSVK